MPHTYWRPRRRFYKKTFAGRELTSKKWKKCPLCRDSPPKPGDHHPFSLRRGTFVKSFPADLRAERHYPKSLLQSTLRRGAAKFRKFFACRLVIERRILRRIVAVAPNGRGVRTVTVGFPRKRAGRSPTTASTPIAVSGFTVRTGLQPIRSAARRSANMIPGYQDPDRVGPTGPADPGLSLLAVQSLDGRPIAVVANYSMHYFEWKPVSADYFGLFCKELAERIGPQNQVPPPVVMLSQGTAGDQQWFDFSQPAKSPSINVYTEGVAKVAHNAYKTIQYRDDITLAMADWRRSRGEGRGLRKADRAAIPHGRILANAAAQSKCVFRTDSDFRSIPVFFKAVGLVRTGKIGKLKTIRMSVPCWNLRFPCSQPCPSRRNWITTCGRVRRR